MSDYYLYLICAQEVEFRVHRVPVVRHSEPRRAKRDEVKNLATLWADRMHLAKDRSRFFVAVAPQNDEKCVGQAVWLDSGEQRFSGACFVQGNRVSEHFLRIEGAVSLSSQRLGVSASSK